MRTMKLVSTARTWLTLICALVVSQTYPAQAIPNPDDQYWQSGFNVQGIDGPVLALGNYGVELIAGGDFKVAGSVQARNIASWNGSVWDSLECRNERQSVCSNNV